MGGGGLGTDCEGRREKSDDQVAENGHKKDGINDRVQMNPGKVSLAVAFDHPPTLHLHCTRGSREAFAPTYPSSNITRDSEIQKEGGILRCVCQRNSPARATLDQAITLAGLVTCSRSSERCCNRGHGQRPNIAAKKTDSLSAVEVD